MGFDPTKNVGQVLKTHYERILHPFDMFQKNKLQNKLKTRGIGVDPQGSTLKKEIKVEKRTIEVVELSDEEDHVGKKLCSEDSKENVKKEIVEMEGNNYTPHGIISRYYSLNYCKNTKLIACQKRLLLSLGIIIVFIGL